MTNRRLSCRISSDRISQWYDRLITERRELDEQEPYVDSEDGCYDSDWDDSESSNDSAALLSLQLPQAEVSEGFDALAGSQSRRSSACGSADHAIAGGGGV